MRTVFSVVLRSYSACQCHALVVVTLGNDCLDFMNLKLAVLVMLGYNSVYVLEQSLIDVFRSLCYFSAA